MQFLAVIASLFLVAASGSASPMIEERTVNLKYYPNFLNKGCAVQAPDYMTYSIKGSVDDCLDFCDSVAGCKFVNTYVDVNSVKENGFTCALFKSKHGLSSLSNCGGQDQGTGNLNKIRHSAGWVKWL